MRSRRALVALLVLLVSPVGGPPAARSTSVVELLDDYAAGRFDAVVATLAEAGDFQAILEQFRRDVPAWLDAAGPAARERRELVAATVALEAARAGQWHEWKWIQKQPPMCAGTECYDPPSILYWKGPPLLVEWGCELLRKHATPRPIERWWQLAALAVAQRSEDVQFMVGDPYIGRGFKESHEIGNLQDEIKHLDHTMERFPKEMRFVLAQGIARDRHFREDAIQVYRALENHPDVGGEALMRLGAMHLPRRSSNHVSLSTPLPFSPDASLAMRSLSRAEELTRDPYVIHLARYFRARLLEQQGRLPDAEAAYRGAVAAVPHAQSATIALAALTFRDGRREEAYRLIGDMLSADPPPLDPARAYVHADDRFWPYLVEKLRQEIQRHGLHGSHGFEP
jgi:tetratricopeptide (TPR) repeat protein